MMLLKGSQWFTERRLCPKREDWPVTLTLKDDIELGCQPGSAVGRGVADCSPALSSWVPTGSYSSFSGPYRLLGRMVWQISNLASWVSGGVETGVEGGVGVGAPEPPLHLPGNSAGHLEK